MVCVQVRREIQYVCERHIVAHGVSKYLRILSKNGCMCVSVCVCVTIIKMWRIYAFVCKYIEVLCYQCTWRCSPEVMGTWWVFASRQGWCPSAAASGTSDYSLLPALRENSSSNSWVRKTKLVDKFHTKPCHKNKHLVFLSGLIWKYLLQWQVDRYF